MDTNQSLYNLVQQFSRRLLIDETRAIRLYQNVSTISNANGPMQSMDSMMSVCSANELGQSCRICRWNRSDLPIQQCPCECKGSVGYVHLKCLRRWILHRGDDHCEICGAQFSLCPEKRSYSKTFSSFFQARYLGAVLKNCAHLVALAPISYVVLYQVLKVMDNLQFEEQNTLQVVVLAPALLLTSSIIFFHILEFSITRCLVIKNILKHWWNFGGQESDPGLDTEVSSEFYEFF